MLYLVLSYRHEAENDLFFSAQRRLGSPSLVDLVCVFYWIGPNLD